MTAEDIDDLRVTYRTLCAMGLHDRTSERDRLLLQEVGRIVAATLVDKLGLAE